MIAIRRGPLALAALAAAGFGPLGAAAEDPSIETYTARYEAEYRGRKIGFSELEVDYDAARDVYRFESRTVAKGLAKLLRPDPAVERSEFVVDAGSIRPLEFEFVDGSRSGEDNLRVSFDWSANAASVESGDGQMPLSLPPGTLDRGTLQVALMRDLAQHRDPGPYTLADGDSLKTYRYSVGAEQQVETPAGTFDALVLTQEREGSSRRTVLWVAPALGYLPVRIEQLRDGEVNSLLVLERVDGIGTGKPQD